MSEKIFFAGTGNMGGAILRGLLKAGTNPSTIFFFDPSDKAAAEVTALGCVRVASFAGRRHLPLRKAADFQAGRSRMEGRRCRRKGNQDFREHHGRRDPQGSHRSPGRKEPDSPRDAELAAYRRQGLRWSRYGWSYRRNTRYR